MDLAAVHIPGLTRRLPGLVTTDHTFTVPLDHARPERGTVELYGREVVAPSGLGRNQSWLVYLQGGPGGKCPRPLRRDSWLQRACEEYRVLLLDQRGTGRSTPATSQTLAALPSPEAQADYLACFRADAIVADGEAVRRSLLGAEGTWTLLGQSFGGFCVLRYLSAAPGGVREALITGGVPSLSATAVDVYRAAYPRVRSKNAAYFRRYPDDQQVLRDVLARLRDTEARLPTGERLTPRRLQYLGLALGMSDGFEQVHYLLEEAWVRVGGRLELSDGFLAAAGAHLSHVQGPLFAALHEAIYGQGEASGWAAHRVRGEFPEFDDAAPEPLFTGEMIYPWLFDEDPALRPLAAAADLLARRDDWPALYDPAALAHNTVPVAAAVYADDMYVDRRMSEQTAAAVPGLRLWITGEYEHDGLHRDGERVLGRLLDMVRGEA